MYKIMTPGPTQVAENVRLARSRECTNPDPTGTGNTLIIEFRGKAAKYSGSKPNDLADDFYK